MKEPFDRIGRLKELSEKFGWLDAYRKANRDKMVGDSRGIKRIEEHEILPFAPIEKVEKVSNENTNMSQNNPMSNIPENKSIFKKKLLKQADVNSFLLSSKPLHQPALTSPHGARKTPTSHSKISASFSLLLRQQNLHS